jgi:hypothetical protein
MTVNEKLIDKIRKLRAKARGTNNEAEAAAFAAKVQELLAEHGLSETALGSDKTEEESIGRTDHKFSGSPARQVMLRAVCKFYMCIAIRNTSGPWIIVGKPTNVMVAIDMFEYLLSTVVRMSNTYARENPGGNKIDWRRGCMSRLAERLDKLRRAELEKKQERHAGGGAANLPALIHDEGRAAALWMKQNIQTTTHTTRVKQGDDAARGRAAAEGIGLHRQVGGGGGRLMIGKQ